MLETMKTAIMSAFARLLYNHQETHAPVPSRNSMIPSPTVQVWLLSVPKLATSKPQFPENMISHALVLPRVARHLLELNAV